MRKQYLHLCAYLCDSCRGPVVSASLAVRENPISKETDIRQVGAICLSCGHRQQNVTGTTAVRHFLPMEWEPEDPTAGLSQTTALLAALNRTDLS
jgi:hypothetical protein